MAIARLGYLGLGSNLADRAAYLGRAATLLAAVPGLYILRASRIYESPPWGYVSAHAYLNQVLEITWDGGSRELSEAGHAIELNCQRTRIAQAADSAADLPQYSDRTLDIDLLWLTGEELSTDELTLPHPLAHTRAFVLVPWCELAPDLNLHGRPLRDWLAELTPGEVAQVVPYHPDASGSAA